MDEKQSTASFYAVIPARVLMDKELRPNAKLLYAVISNLCNLHGYCWATNERLGENLDIAAKTVSSLISQLSSRDLIAVQLIRDQKSNEITERRIWLKMPKITLVEEQTPMFKNEHTLPSKMSIPMPKNEEEKKIGTNIPPEAPQGGRRRRENRTEPEWKPQRFARFWEFYRLHARGESKQAAIRAWDRLKPSDELITRMGRALQKQIQSEDWKAGIGIPYASTWLNNQRWLDEPKAAERAVEPECEAAPREGWC